RKGLALWNILSDAGKSVAVVNWLITYPPEKINGVMISDHTLASLMRGQEFLGEVFAEAQGLTLSNVKGSHNSATAVYPREWEQRVLAPEHTKAVLTDIANPFLNTAPDTGFGLFLRQLNDFWDTNERLASIALEIIDEKKPDV